MAVSPPAPGGGRDKPPHPSKRDLPTARLRLIKLMQSVNFGRIESLSINGGQPMLDPPPRVIREHKFGGENGPRPELGNADFLLKQQVVELFAFFDRHPDGVIEVLEIKHGLPFRMTVEGQAA